MSSLGPLFEPRQARVRESQRSALEDEGNAINAALFEDLDSAGLSDAEVCERVPRLDRGQLSRIRTGGAHPPSALVAFALDHTRCRPPRYLVAVCAAADYEPTPRPPPDVAEVFAAYRDELAVMQLDDVLRERVERRLGVQLSPTPHAPQAREATP